MKLEKSFTIGGKVVQPTGNHLGEFTLYETVGDREQITIFFPHRKLEWWARAEYTHRCPYWDAGWCYHDNAKTTNQSGDGGCLGSDLCMTYQVESLQAAKKEAEDDN